MRPSENKAREAQRKAHELAMQEYLNKGGVIHVYGPDAYKQEGYKLAQSTLNGGYTNRAALARRKEKEKERNGEQS